MPVDGTYGRLGTHNQRMKTLRRRRNSDGGYDFMNPVKVQRIDYEKADPELLQQIKMKILRKRKIDTIKDYVAIFCSLIIGIVTFYFFVHLMAG